MEAVWSATLTVGRASDSKTTYMGYFSSPEITGGALDVNTFIDDGVGYRIIYLVFQQTCSVQQLVLNTDKTLPNGLILQAGDDPFPVADSDALGLKTISTYCVRMRALVGSEARP